MSGDEAPPRSPTPERADAPEGDRGGSPDRGRDRSRSPPPRGRDSRSRSRSRDPPRADDRGRSPGAYGGGGGGGRKMGIAGRWNSRGFGTYIDASLSHGGHSLPDDARIRRRTDRIGAPFFRCAASSSRSLRAGRARDGDRKAPASANRADPRARRRRESPASRLLSAEASFRRRIFVSLTRLRPSVVFSRARKLPARPWSRASRE